ncbi:MAG: exodeoxyribonuclease VII small subunit [Fibrobacter sp.]|jgi:exodeoxyribonuclease VII small subunit|nr:exodeoxyribonuclease VII small subunit [Fibrobacter sp.]
MSEQNNRYQNAMTRLEEILSKIDRSDVSVDELASQVEEATQLLRECKAILSDTEKNVQKALSDLNEEAEKDSEA